MSAASAKVATGGKVAAAAAAASPSIGAAAATAASASSASASTPHSQYMDELVESFVLRLKRRELVGSNATALHTVDLLRMMISKKKYNTVQEMIDLIRSVGRTLTNAHPIELCIGNVVRRVLFIIRHEAAALVKELSLAQSDSTDSSHAGPLDSQPSAASVQQVDLSLSLHKILDIGTHPEAAQSGLDLPSAIIQSQLKPQVLEEIGILVDEIKAAESHIAEQAIEHLYAKEVIMTFGVSHTVTSFLKEAAKFRRFEVIVVESAPSMSGHRMAATLAQLGMDTTVIADAAVFALMPSVNKVILGTHAVMANGGLVAFTGASNIALAAAHHSVPVMVVTGLHKLCPLYAMDGDTFNEQSAPSQLLKFDEINFGQTRKHQPSESKQNDADCASDDDDEDDEDDDDEEQDAATLIDVQNPAYDYVEPKLVSLFITNIGGHNPSYIYRLLAEYYNPQDYTL